MITTEKEPTVATLTINTLIKGPVEINDDQIITFNTPLLGFSAALKRWLIYQT